MRQQKESDNRSVGEFKVERLAMQVEKGRIDAHIVPATWSETLDLVELGNARALCLNNVGLFKDALAQGQRRIVVLIRQRHLEAALDHGDLVGGVVLMELECDFILILDTV